MPVIASEPVRTETWSHDAFGRLDVHTDFEGQRAVHGRDDTAVGQGRLLQVRDFGDPFADPDSDGDPTDRTASCTEDDPPADGTVLINGTGTVYGTVLRPTDRHGRVFPIGRGEATLIHRLRPPRPAHPDRRVATRPERGRLGDADNGLRRQRHRLGGVGTALSRSRPLPPRRDRRPGLAARPHRLHRRRHGDLGDRTGHRLRPGRGRPTGTADGRSGRHHRHRQGGGRSQGGGVRRPGASEAARPLRPDGPGAAGAPGREAWGGMSRRQPAWSKCRMALPVSRRSTGRGRRRLQVLPLPVGQVVREVGAAGFGTVRAAGVLRLDSRLRHRSGDGSAPFRTDIQTAATTPSATNQRRAAMRLSGSPVRRDRAWR